MGLCGACNLNISVTQKRVKCSSSDCSLVYHSECANYDENLVHRSKWVCPSCVASRPKVDNSNTPIQNKGVKIQLTDATPSPCSFDLSLETIMSEIRSFRKEVNNKLELQQSSLNSFSAGLGKLQGEVREIISNFSKIQDELNEATKSLNFLSDFYDEQRTLNELHETKITRLEKENSELRSNFYDLEQKMTQIEQQSRDCNLELQCVPEHKSENLLAIIRKLAEVVDFNLNDNDIVNFHRVAKMINESKRPRNIIIKLSSPLKRDNFLAAVKKFNKKHEHDKLNSSQLGFVGSKQQIYVMEHLSPSNKRLHAATRVAAQERKYTFVWVRGGRIFVRRNDNSPSILIKNLDSLKKL